MIRRIIPVLLIKDGLLYKSVGFDDYNYIGDPINTVKIFNEKEVDELVILDISATKEGRKPDLSLISAMASEAFMPIAYGGGIASVQDAEDVINCGVEKIVLNSAALHDPTLIQKIAKNLGSSSVVVAIDCKKNIQKKYKIYEHVHGKCEKESLFDYLATIQEMGAGEILLTSVNLDGKMKGYDIDLCKKVSNILNIPLVCCGGASSIEDIAELFEKCPGVSAAAGSLFVYYGKHKAVLITYPSYDKIKQLTNM